MIKAGTYRGDNPIRFTVESGSQPLRHQFDWYVARVEHGKEVQAVDHLRNVGFTDTFVPLRLAEPKTFENSHQASRNVLSAMRRVDAVKTYPLWRGYVFCEQPMFTPSVWHLACPADGLRYHGLVKGFLGGWEPDTVSSSCIEDMRARCDANGVVIKYEPPKVHYLPGALVKVLEGPAVGQVLRVVWDNGLALKLQAVQGAGYSVYVPDRRKVEAIVLSSGRAQNNNNAAGPRGKGRLFRRARSAAA